MQTVSGRTFRAYTPVEFTDLEFGFNLPVLLSDAIFGIVNLPREDRLFTADHVPGQIVVGAMAATHGFTEIVSFIVMFLAATLVALLFLPETEGHALG